MEGPATLVPYWATCEGLGGGNAPHSGASRRMVRADLFGRPTYTTMGGNQVHIWRRGSNLIARGRYNGRQFGKTLGDDPNRAESQLRKLLEAIENGTFLMPSEVRRQPLKTGLTPKLILKEIANRFLTEIRPLRGRKTFQDYSSRLAPLLGFAELQSSRRRWPYADCINREFAVELRAHLHSLKVNRNDHPMAAERSISGRQIHNIMSCTATMLNYAKRPDVNLLPQTFANPISRQIVGDRPQKDLLAPQKLPLDLRIRMVQSMDAWTLALLAFPFILPQRPDEFSGLLITDVNRNARELVFATRLAGADFNKGRRSFRVPYPAQLDPIVSWWIGSRTDGPLLLRRKAIDAQIVQQPNNAVQTEQDRKAVVRRLLRNFGGVSTDIMAKTFKRMLGIIAPDFSVRFYDTRGSVSTDLRDAGVDYMLRRYLTGRSLKRDSMADYESADLHREMNRYFDHIVPLLNAISERAAALGIQRMAGDGSGEVSDNRLQQD